MRSRYLFPPLLAAVCWGSAVPAADLAVTGNWSRTVNNADLAAGAGSDLHSLIESGTAEATLDISNTFGGNWAVVARKSAITWPATVSIAVRRTSDGSGGGTIAGGTAYLTLSTTDQTLFTGTGDRSSVQLQLRTDGLSVEHGVGTYSLNVIYTLP